MFSKYANHTSRLLFAFALAACAIMIVSAPALAQFTGKIYYIDGGALKKADLAGTNISTVRASTTASDIEIDLTIGKIFLSSSSFSTMNLDGSDFVFLGGGTAEKFTFNPFDRCIYFGGTTVSTNVIKKFSLETHATTDVFSPLPGVVQDVFFDRQNNKLYWVEQSSNASPEFAIIRRANLDGSVVQNIVNRTNFRIASIDLDLVNNRIYWGGSDTQNGLSSIERSKINGTEIETIVPAITVGTVSVLKVDPSGGKLYWRTGSDAQGKINRVNLDGTGFATVLNVTGLFKVFTIIPISDNLEGACCFLPEFGCVDLFEDECGLVNGFWQGPGTICEVNTCGFGACCLTNGDCFELITEQECFDGKGFYAGDETTCEMADCNPINGACCFGDGGCFELNEEECAILPSGSWNGEHTVCDDDQGTPVCPSGVCCLPIGDCSETLTGADCLNASGTIQIGEDSCANVSCPQPLGACCLANDTCHDLTEAACDANASAVWAGAFTECENIEGTPTCPLGACCLPVGDCVDGLLVGGCTVQNGSFQGFGSECADVACVQPVGACCIADGAGGCLELKDAQCALIANSSWAGPFTDCDDVDTNDIADDCEAPRAGDFNGDRQVTLEDLPAFVDVLLGQPQSPGHVDRADMNGDGIADGLDIPAFIEEQLGGG